MSDLQFGALTVGTVAIVAMYFGYGWRIVTPHGHMSGNPPAPAKKPQPGRKPARRGKK